MHELKIDKFYFGPQHAPDGTYSGIGLYYESSDDPAFRRVRQMVEAEILNCVDPMGKPTINVLSDGSEIFCIYTCHRVLIEEVSATGCRGLLVRRQDLETISWDLSPLLPSLGAPDSFKDASPLIVSIEKPHRKQTAGLERISGLLEACLYAISAGPIRPILFIYSPEMFPSIYELLLTLFQVMPPSEKQHGFAQCYCPAGPDALTSLTARGSADASRRFDWIFSPGGHADIPFVRIQDFAPDEELPKSPKKGMTPVCLVELGGNRPRKKSPLFASWMTKALLRGSEPELHNICAAKLVAKVDPVQWAHQLKQYIVESLEQRDDKELIERTASDFEVLLKMGVLETLGFGDWADMIRAASGKPGDAGIFGKMNQALKQALGDRPSADKYTAYLWRYGILLGLKQTAQAPAYLERIFFDIPWQPVDSVERAWMK